MGKLRIWSMNDIREVIEGCINNKFDMIMFVEGNRGCLSGETKVQTINGIKKIKDIPNTTTLKSFDLKKMEEINSIAIKIDKGLQEVYAVKTSDGRIVEATMEHIFYVIRKKKIIEIPLKNIKEGDELLCQGLNDNTRIVSIKKIGKKKVYDFQVPDYNNFILANDIVVHNCGKSTFTYKLLSSLKTPLPFRPKRDIVFSREDTLKHLATKKGGIIFSDEMVNVSFNRDFYIEEAKILLKALNCYRDSCNVFIGCIPRFVELDKNLQKMCKMRITVVRRGIALIQTQMPSIYTIDGWDVKNNQKIESKWALHGNKNPRFAQLTTVRGIVKFGDLNPKQRRIYEAIKEEKRGKIFEAYKDLTLLGNPQKLFYDKLLEQIISMKLNTETFETFIGINNLEPKKVRNKINAMLKEKGSTKRFKDFVMTSEKKLEKDKYGYLRQKADEEEIKKIQALKEEQPIQIFQSKEKIAEKVEGEDIENNNVFGLVSKDGNSN